MQEQKLQNRKRRALLEGNRALLASISIDLAELFTDHSRHEDAIEEYKEVAEIYQQMGKQIDYATVVRMIGESYISLRNYERALHYQNIYLDTVKKENNQLEEQRALATIGHTHLSSFLDIEHNTDQTSLRLAKQSFMKSLQLCNSLVGVSKHELQDMTARLLANLGNVESGLGDQVGGVELLEKSIKICKSYDLYEQLERNYSSLGAIYAQQNDYNKAINFYNLSIEVADKLKNKVTLRCTSLTAKADILIKLGDFHSAKAVLLKAHKLKHPVTEERNIIEANLKVVAAMSYTEDSLVMLRDSDYKTRKSLYEKLGDGACRLKIFSRAAHYYEKMLEAAKKNGESGAQLSSCYNSLAETYSDNKQFDIALKYYREDSNVCQPNTKDSIQALLNVADCMEIMKTENIGDIEAVYQQAHSEAIVLQNEQMQAKVLGRYIKLLRDHRKTKQTLSLQRELDGLGIKGEEESEEEIQHATPDVGQDIVIADITDISDGSDNEQDVKPKSVRKRRFVVKKNCKGETQLHTACINGKVAVVKHLLEQNHPVNIRDNCGWLPIHEASNHGHIEIVKLLIEKGAAVSDRGGKLCYGVAPLHDAAANGHLEVMQLLLDSGASPIVKSDSGETPLYILKNWRAAHQPENEELYNSIEQRLTEAMERSGQMESLVQERNLALIVDGDTSGSNSTQIKRRESTTPEPKSSRRRPNLRKTVEDLPLTTVEDSSNSSTISSLLTENDSRDPPQHIEESSVTDMYRQVMKQVRYPLRDESSEKKRKSDEISSAYFDEDDVKDDWLEDDLPSSLNKKRKTSSETLSLMNSNNRRTFEKNKSNSSLKNSSKGFDEEIPEEFFDLDYTPRVIPEDVPMDLRSPKKRATQTSLANHGFIRHRSFNSVNSSGSNNKQPKITDFGSISSGSFESIPSALIEEMNISKMFNDPIWSADIHIDGKLYRVPIPAAEIHSKTIKWLTEEAAKRYSRKENVKPSLELETKNGAILAEDDFVSILFSAGTSQTEELQARIIKWNLPPLSDRYVEACTGSGTVPQDHIIKITKEASTAIDITDMGFRSRALSPLCKAINRQTNLHLLCLFGNSLSSDSMQLLCAALPTLVNLTVLNLGLTRLSYDSLEMLADMFTQSTKSILENLAVLDLSYNHLGDESFKSLAIITRYLRLQTLNLISVDFTSEVFSIIQNKSVSLNMDYMLNFDISYNNLQNEQIATFLSWLKPEKIEKLNISNNGTKNGLLKHVTNWLESRTHEKFDLKALNLSRCLAVDAEVFELLRVLTRAKTSFSLNLSYNDDLTSLSLRRLLQHQPVLLDLDLTGCENIFRYFEECSEILGDYMKCQKLKLSVDYYDSTISDMLIGMWRDEYKERAEIRQLHGFIELYVNS